MKKSFILAINIAFLSICVRVAAAPVPGMGSSRLADLELGIPFMTHGFRLPVKSSNWTLTDPSDEHGLGVGNLTFHHQHLATSALSLRLETMRRSQSLESNARRWVRDYLHYGFDLLGTRTFQSKGQRGFVVDLIHREKQKQLRQVIYQDDRRLAVFTLSASKPEFEKALADFNSVVHEFQWANDPPTKIKTF